MDADQLLLEWAQKRVSGWLEKQVETCNANRPYTYFVDKLYEMAYRIKAASFEHLLNCTPHVYGIPGHEWECSCYSEYTRDDRWMVHTYITCHHGVLAQMVEEISPWRMPEVIQQLAEADEGCRYDDDDYGW